MYDFMASCSTENDILQALNKKKNHQINRFLFIYNFIFFKSPAAITPGRVKMRIEVVKCN